MTKTPKQQEHDTTCPQCTARGRVPGAAYGSMVKCKLCKGTGYTTVEHCLANGWPADVLREVTRVSKLRVAVAMLTGADE